MKADMNLVTFKYRNHRGEEEVRRVLPIRIWHGSTAWHPHPQLLMEAFCLDKQATRDFAMSGLLSPVLPLEDPESAQRVLSGWIEEKGKGAGSG